MNSPKRFILLVDHGSRSPEANQVVEDIADMLRRAEAAPVVVAHLQFAEPTIADAVDACAKAGATEIVVVPVFLSPGKHSMKDIPRMVDEALRKHSGITYSMASPLGAHLKIAEVIVERIESAVED